MFLADWIVLAIFFLIMVGIGFWSFKKVSSTSDFYVAGGKLPWWLSGISHHVSGYSGAVFVAYAALAYSHGITLYFWWALTIAISIIGGSRIFPPAWVRLRQHYGVQSPMEYLERRYSVLTQQLMACSGILLKLFDVTAKWAAIAILLNTFTGIPIFWGILFSGGISLIYITIGGLWADVWTDFAQFVVQIIAGVVMFFMTISYLNAESVSSIWQQLPPQNTQPFHEPFSVWFAIAFLIINFLSYNGGTWNLATRYISSQNASDARKAALLSGLLYLIWPLILFFPMWTAPVFLPDLVDLETSYAKLTQLLLPQGLVGLVLASMFANTMSMTSSDINTISAVITRDVLPKIMISYSEINALSSARIVTFLFTLTTVILATQAEAFGGVFGLIISWFGALVGPISIPMLFGMIKAFRKSGAISAITSILLGFLTFVSTKYWFDVSQVTEIISPVLVSMVSYILLGLVLKDGLSAQMDDNFYINLKTD